MYLNVIDNFIDYNLLEKEKNIFLYKTPHMWGHSSKGGIKFYSTQISPNSPFIDYIHKRINQEVLNLNTEIIRSYINIQQGEFVDQDGNVQSQLYEADRSKEWFVVAAMFMGEIILKTIPYYRLVYPSGAHLIKTDKYIDTNFDKK